MKHFIFLLLSLLLISCEDDGPNHNNPYVPNYNFSFEVNTNLPLYSGLHHTGNSVYIPNYGARGVYVFNAGSYFTAFDAACPNQYPTDCSTLQKVGVNLKCPCDEVEYSFFTGLPMGEVDVQYGLKTYRTQFTNGVIRVYN